MTEITIKYLPYMLSAIGVWMNVLAGNMHKSAWLVGLIGQTLWIIWIIVSENWGFIILNISLWWVYFRNHRKWNKDPS